MIVKFTVLENDISALPHTNSNFFSQKPTLKAHFVEDVFVLNTFFAWLLYEAKFGLYRTHIISPCEMSMQIKMF